MIKILYNKRFRKNAQKLPKHIQRKFERLEFIFRVNQFAPQLRTHRLNPPFENKHAFAITREYRVVFEFSDNATVVFLDIGTHEIYKS